MTALRLCVFYSTFHHGNCWFRKKIKKININPPFSSHWSQKRSSKISFFQIEGTTSRACHEHWCKFTVFIFFIYALHTRINDVTKLLLLLDQIYAMTNERRNFPQLIPHNKFNIKEVHDNFYIGTHSVRFINIEWI